MVALYKANQVRGIDQAEIGSGTPGITLMKRAGTALFDKMTKLWPSCDELVVLCGGGNNAGDGYVVAALAKKNSLPVRVYFVKAIDELKGDARLAAKECMLLGVDCFDASSLQKGFRFSGSRPVILDALLGTGFSGALSTEYLALVKWINKQDIPVLAVDLPSGIYSDTGAIAQDKNGLEQSAVQANATVSFIGRKQGLYTGAGKACSGKLFFDDLCASRDSYSRFNPSAYLLAPSNLRSLLTRNTDSHKGRHGHVAVLGGRVGTGGAGLLAAEASLRSGAGLTTLFSEQRTIDAALSRIPEAMTVLIENSGNIPLEKLEKASVICIGPGLGLDQRAVDVANKALNLNCPQVLDADALTLLAEGRITISEQDKCIMTPHPGEAARLLNSTSYKVQLDRFSAIEELQNKYGGVVVLKGAGTLVCAGSTTWVCDKGNPGMAVGGMGDVLSGLLAALLAQGLSLTEAAQLGVWAHSYAADVQAEKSGQVGLLASDLLPTIRQILNGKTV